MISESRAPDDIRGAWALYSQWKSEVSSMERNEVLAEQVREARNLLIHAHGHVPLWTQLLNGRDPNELSWQEVPKVDRALLADRFADSLSSEAPNIDALIRSRRQLAAPLPNGHRIFLSAGKAGKLLVFIYDTPMWKTFLSAVLRRFSYTDLDRIDRRFRLSLVGTSDPSHTLPRLRMLFPKAKVQVVGLQHGLTEAAGALNKFQPDVLLGFSSGITLMAETQMDGAIRIKPKYVFVGTDGLGADDRAVIERVWGVQPYDAYSCTEAGVVAFECVAHEGMHINEDLVMLEVVEGQVIVTNLVNRIQPIIRCAIPDRVQLEPSPCNCGLPYMRLRPVDGRVNRTFELPGRSGKRIRIHPIVIRSALDPFFGAVASLVSVRGNEIEFEILGEVDVPKVRRRLRLALQRAGVDVHAIRLQPKKGQSPATTLNDPNAISP